MPKVLAAYAESPKDVYFETQERGEKIILLLRRHWVTNIPWLAILLLMLSSPLLLMLLALLYGWEAPIPPKLQMVGLLIWYLLALGFGLESFITWYFNVHIVTNKRLVDVDFWGLLFKNVAECPLSQIQDVTHQVGGIFQIIFDFGDVYVQTAAAQPRFELLRVPHPALAHDKITDLVESVLGGYRGR